jgi:hypothetical protein
LHRPYASVFRQPQRAGRPVYTDINSQSFGEASGAYTDFEPQCGRLVQQWVERIKLLSEQDRPEQCVVPRASYAAACRSKDACRHHCSSHDRALR